MCVQAPFAQRKPSELYRIVVIANLLRVRHPSEQRGRARRSGKTESCQTRGLVHGVPASGVTTTPTMATAGLERRAVQGKVQTKTRSDGALSTSQWCLNEAVSVGVARTTTLPTAGSSTGTLEGTELLQDVSTQGAHNMDPQTGDLSP